MENQYVLGGIVGFQETLIANRLGHGVTLEYHVLHIFLMTMVPGGSRRLEKIFVQLTWRRSYLFVHRLR